MEADTRAGGAPIIPGPEEAYSAWYMQHKGACVHACASRISVRMHAWAQAYTHARACAWCKTTRPCAPQVIIASHLHCSSAFLAPEFVSTATSACGTQFLCRTPLLGRAHFQRRTPRRGVCALRLQENPDLDGMRILAPICIYMCKMFSL